MIAIVLNEIFSRALTKEYKPSTNAIIKVAALKLGEETKEGELPVDALSAKSFTKMPGKIETTRANIAIAKSESIFLNVGKRSFLFCAFSIFSIFVFLKIILN